MVRSGERGSSRQVLSLTRGYLTKCFCVAKLAIDFVGNVERSQKSRSRNVGSRERETLQSPQIVKLPIAILSSVVCLVVLLIASGAIASECSDRSIELRGAWGKARFAVEVADTERERAVGLMHRKTLPSSAGMLFVYARSGRVSFWMRNTFIPLDIIFANEDGVVQKVHSNATPLDETPIPGGDRIRYVLEINGGLAKAIGISVGSVMRHPAILQESAEWPC